MNGARIFLKAFTLSALNKPFKMNLWKTVLAFLLMVFLTGINGASAATITITTQTDELNTNGNCSLREAITNINNGATTYADCVPTGSYGTSDTINIPAGTYTITIPGADEFLNATGSFDFLKSVTVVGAGADTTTINGGGQDRVFYIGRGNTVSISGVTITNGLSGGGSGIYNGGTLTITNSTISNNATSGGGTCGGGIANDTLSGPTTVINSAIVGNTAVYCGGGIISWRQFTITNSTIAGNSAGSYGGGIFRGASGSGPGSITNATISGNSTINGGGIWNDGGDQVTLYNSIVANQTSGANCGGSITNGGNNIDSGTSCGWGSTNGSGSSTDPQLGTLANNGGPTQTMALLAGSPAINGVTYNSPNGAPATDQRGVTRPQGSGYDIGAYELQLQQPTPVPTMNEWGAIFFMVFAGVASVYYLRREKRV